MLVTALLLAAMMTGDGQSPSMERPGPLRTPSTSAPLSKRFSTLFAVEGSPTAASSIRRWDLSPRNRIGDPRLLHQDRQEIICGLTVVRKSTDIDPRIIVPPNRDVLSALRRIEPDTCLPASGGTPPRR